MPAYGWRRAAVRAATKAAALGAGLLSVLVAVPAAPAVAVQPVVPATPTRTAEPPAASASRSVFVWYDTRTSLAERVQRLGLARADAASGAAGAPAGVASGAVPGTGVVTVPAGQDASAVAARLRTQPGVQVAIPDLPVRLDAAAPDYFRAGRLWGLQNTGQVISDPDVGEPERGVVDVDTDAPAAWKTTEGSWRTIVAVVDTGIDINHPDLKPSIWTNPRPKALNRAHPTQKDVHGWDFCHDDGSVYDPGEYVNDDGERELNDLHGTHVAGTIAAADDRSGVVGVAPRVTIMPLKAFGQKANGQACGSDDIFQALLYAGTHGAKVVNASWTIDQTTPADRTELDRFFTLLGQRYGMVVVAAAGNGDVDEYGDEIGFNIDTALAAQAAGHSADVPYPAASKAPNVITVGAVDHRGSLATFSNFGAHSVDVVAPGVSIWSTVPGVLTKGNYAAAYAFLSGTSMAAPHVSGEAALLLSMGHLPAQQVVRRIEATAKPLRTLRRGTTATGGIADADRALRPGSAIAVTARPATVPRGGQVVVSASLHDAVTWAPRAGQRLMPCLRALGTVRWSCLRPIPTSRTGTVTIRLRPVRSVNVRFRFPGAAGTPAVVGPTVTLSVVRPVSLALAPATVARGHVVTARGRVTGTSASVLVRLQELRAARWRDVLVGRTNSRGGYRFRVALSLTGVRSVRVEADASAGFGASTSAVRLVTVR